MALLSSILTIVITPIILISSLLLIPLAVLTTLFAVAALIVRVAIIYIELFLNLVQNHLSNLRYSPSVLDLSPAKRPRSLRSISTTSSGLQTPRLSQNGFTYAANTALTRDFEGVGGWRYPNEDTEGEEEWITLNSRLELPAIGAIPEERKRRHQRSLTQGSLGDRVAAGKQKIGSKARSAAVDGSTSPGGQLMEGGRTKSAMFLNEAVMNVGRPRGRRRKSESSESSGSGKTLTMHHG